MPLQPHQFAPEEPDSPDCTECNMPAGNRVHTPTTNTPEPAAAEPTPAATTLDTRDRAVDAAFHDVWMGSGPRARVFHAIAQATAGATDDELMHKTAALHGMLPNTIRPRRIELAEAGLVVPMRAGDGKIVRRATITGSPAQVWVLSAAARRLIDAQPRTYRATA